jgi:multidrug resistance efflux pump
MTLTTTVRDLNDASRAVDQGPVTVPRSKSVWARLWEAFGAIAEWLGRPARGVLMPPACKQFERRLACAGIGALVSSTLMLAPAMFSAIIVDRALASRSIETVVVVGIGVVFLIAVQIGLIWASKTYLVESWNTLVMPGMTMADTDDRRRAMVTVDKAVRSGAVWDAFSIGAVPVLAIYLGMIHPSLVVFAIASALVLAVSEQFGTQLLSQFALAVSTVGAMALSATLVIADMTTPGGLLAATVLAARILAPLYSLAHNWHALIAAHRSYRTLKAWPQFIGMRGAIAHDLAANGHARMVVLLVGVVLLTIMGLLILPMPQVVVLHGRAASEGHIKIVRSTVPGRVLSLHAADNDDVTSGQVLLRLDGREIGAQINEVERQMSIEDGGLKMASDANGRRIELLNRQLAAIRPLVVKTLKPEAEQTAAELRVAEAEIQWQSTRTQALGALSRLAEKKSELQRQRDHMVIRSPATGRVQQMVGLGENSSVAPQDQLLIVVPSTLSIIEAPAAPPDRAGLKIGDSATIRVKIARSRYGDEIEGKIITITPDANEKGNYIVSLKSDQQVGAGAEVEVIVRVSDTSAVGWMYDIIAGSMRRTAR